MLPIQKKITPYNRKETNGRTIQGLVIHAVGAVSSARNNAEYYASKYLGASAHYFCDEKEIWQSVEDKDAAWHCGTAKCYTQKHPMLRNSNTIGIEMCQDTPSTVSAGTIRNTADLVQYLMEKYNIPVDKVVRHWDVVNKKCPSMYIEDGSWTELKAALTGQSLTVGPGAAAAGDSAAQAGSSALNYHTTLPIGITLKKGSKGRDVGILQTALNRLIQAGLSVDLDFGTKTQEAVMAFQKRYSSVCGAADGIVGQKTISAVNTLLKGGSIPTSQPEAVQTPSPTAPQPTTSAQPAAPAAKKSYSQHIHDLQWSLNQDGFTDSYGRKLTEDGLWGTNTAAAVANVCLSTKTIRRYTSVTSWVQCRVGASVDGLYGNATKEAVRAFQASHGLTADGIAGKDTMTEIARAYAPGAF